MSSAWTLSSMPSNDKQGAERINLVAVIGPTAVGKTTLALTLAQRFGGEIVGADSRQIYRYMDVGTAKPTAGERARVPHHLIDIVDPDETLTLGQYQQLAIDAIADIAGRGRLPILVGGTGLYVKTVVEGWTIPRVPPDHALRGALAREAESYGPTRLHQQLQSVDPAAARKVDPRNVRRVIRYLEVYHATGEPISSRQSKEPPPYQTLQLGLTLRRERLYEHIDARVDAMLRDGLLDEVRGLLARGYAETLPALSGFGYRQLIAYLRGSLSFQQAVHETKKETRRFVRRQYAWFPLDDPNILWLDADEHAFEKAADALVQFIQ